MSVFFTSDIHAGDKNCNVKYRGFASEEEYHEFVFKKWKKFITKRDKIFILGDAAKSSSALMLYKELPGYKHFVFGNHDNLKKELYLEVFDKVDGFFKYDNCWVSHCPIHSQEIFNRPNIHGHLHSKANNTNKITHDRIMIGDEIDHRYFNVNVDMNDYSPVPFDLIHEYFTKHKSYGDEPGKRG